MRATIHPKPRRTLSQILIYFLIFSTPYVLWHSLCTIARTHTPIVVVTSESMEPVFQRGDFLFVSNRTSIVELGDVVVCWVENRRLPFVHRIIEKHALAAGTRGNESIGELSGATYAFLTRGDNSPLDDTVLYPPGQRYLFRRDIVGSVRGSVPYIGLLALLFGDFPWLKQVALAISALVFVCELLI